MLLPDKVSETFAKAFYDKPIQILGIEVIKETDGGIVKRDSIKSELLGNVRFNNFGISKNEIGNIVDADITITCMPDVDIQIDDRLKYRDVIYGVSEILRSDSHLTIIGIKCQ